jgi:hypothetical protein
MELALNRRSPPAYSIGSLAAGLAAVTLGVAVGRVF